MKLYNKYSVSIFSRDWLCGRVFVIDQYFFEEVPKYSSYNLTEIEANLYGFSTLKDASGLFPEKIYQDDGEMNIYDWKKYDQKYTLSRYRCLKLERNNETQYIVVRKINEPNLEFMHWKLCDGSMTIKSDKHTFFYKKQDWISEFVITDVTADAKVLYYANQVNNSWHHKFKKPAIADCAQWIGNRGQLYIPKTIKPTIKSKFDVKYFYETGGKWIEIADLNSHLYKRDIIILFRRPKNNFIISYYVKARKNTDGRIDGFPSYHWDTPEGYKKQMEKLYPYIMA